MIPILAAALVLTGPVAVGRSRADGAKPIAAVALAGCVIERETGKPVNGAEIVVERSIRGAEPHQLPAWVGSSTMRTDADGRFRLEVPPEQVAEPRLCIAMRIGHPEFVRRKSRRVLFAAIVRGLTRGEEPFFATIPLDRGLEYTAQVVVPGGKPAAGIPYAFEIVTAKTIHVTPILTDDAEGQTDDDGRVRIRLPKAQGLAIGVGPPHDARARFPFAPYQHYWGIDRPAERPDLWAPTELGRIELSRGVRLSGRMVDTQGRPIAGQTVNAYAMKGRDRHSTTTDADGTFALGPLRPANYVIYGEGQSPHFDFDFDAPPSARVFRVVRPVGVYLQGAMSPEPVVLREIPTAQVEVRFVDSKGKPARGGTTRLSGLLPQDQGRPLFFLIRPKGELTSQLNRPEPKDVRDPLAWGAEQQADASGRIVFRAPLGLQNATISVPPSDEILAYKHRLDPHGPPIPGPPARLGVLEGDRLLTMIEYRAPTILVSARTEDGVVPADLSVIADYRLGRTNYGNLFVRQPDGRFRSESLMPDHEYQVRVRDRGGVYELPPLQRVSLPEGGSVELSFPLRKPGKPIEVGQPAPSFVVRTIDGRALSLASLRGKTVLLHFWYIDARAPDFASVKAVRARFGNDDRLAMLGLCLSEDTERAAELIRLNGVSWSQALLRDGWYDRIVVAFGANRDRSYLIGPDGRLLARDLGGVAVEKAVADALAGR